MSSLSKEEVCREFGRIVDAQVSAEIFMRIAWDLGARRAVLRSPVLMMAIETPSKTGQDLSMEEWNIIISRWVPDAKAISAGGLPTAMALVERWNDLMEQAYADVSRQNE